MNDKTKLAVKEELAPEVLRPAGSVAQIVAAYKEYEELKRQLLTDNDWYSVAGQPPKLRRSGWQKLATAFALEDDLVEESEIQDSVDPAHWTVKITVEARAKSGRTSTGVGACSTREFQWRVDPDGRITYPQLSKRTGQYEVMPLAHFVRTKAHTRAKLRAIADMLGGAEQVEEEQLEPEQPAPKAPTPPPATASTPRTTGQQSIDAGQRAVLVHYLETILGEDITECVDIEQTDGELLIKLDRRHGEHLINSFIGKMIKWGYGCHETAQGITARISKPKG